MKRTAGAGGNVEEGDDKRQKGNESYFDKLPNELAKYRRSKSTFSLPQCESKLLESSLQVFTVCNYSEKDLSDTKVGTVQNMYQKGIIEKLNKKIVLEQGAVRTFMKMDGNGDGSVSMDEFCNFLKLDKTDEDVIELFELFDEDNDGVISGEEFHSMMNDAQLNRQDLYQKLNRMIEDQDPEVTIESVNKIVARFNTQKDKVSEVNQSAFKAVKKAMKEVDLSSELKIFLENLWQKPKEELDMFANFFKIGALFTSFIKDGNPEELTYPEKEISQFFQLKQKEMEGVKLTLLDSQDLL